LQVDGAASFGSAPLPGTNLSLAVHRRVGGVLDEPDVLRAVRAELQEELWEARTRRAVDGDDRRLSIGRDGLAVIAASDPLKIVSPFRELRQM